MIMHGFNPAKHMIQEFIEFCETIEFAEGNERHAQFKEMKSQTDQIGSMTGSKWCSKSSERGKSKKAKTTGKWCPLHETNTHNANQCKVLQSQAKKMQAQWEASKGKYSMDPAWHSSGSTNKSKTSMKEKFATNLKEFIKISLKEAFLSEKKACSVNKTFNIEDFEEMELSDDKYSTNKEWLLTSDRSDDMSISELELTNSDLGLESSVEVITYLANEIFTFRRVLNGRPKKLVNKEGIELAPILFGLLRTALH